MKTTNLTAIDLFCGAGGLTLGLKQAGFRVVAGVELNPIAAETYRLNHEDVDVYEKDICDINPSEILEKFNLKPGELDLLAGCPPCQGFSSQRTRNKTNAQLAFAESLLWILESKKFKLERFTTQGTHAGNEYVLKVIRSQLNEERKQQLIDAPCITEEQAEKIERLKLKTSEQLNALEALKVKISLGYAHSYKLTEADLLLKPADLKRFNAFRGLTTVYDDSNENAVSRKFNDQRAKAYKEILGNLKPNSTFGKDEITAVMTYVVQERFRFAMLGIVNNKFGRIYRDKKGNVKPYTFKSLKQMTQDFLELLRRIGISTKDTRTKASKNTNANRLQCSDEVKKCLTSGICYIANSVSETKTDRENLYQISAASWEAIEHHADRLVIKKGLKPLPIVLETRRGIAAHVANDDFIWIDAVPIKNTLSK